MLIVIVTDIAEALCCSKMLVTGFQSTCHDISEALNIHNLFLSYEKTASADWNLKIWLRIDYEYIWK